jgi:sirohydrochlorin cobaltochelatase
VLPSRVVAQTEAFAADHPRLDVRIAEPIGDCDELAEIVIERYHETGAGDIRMNCDTCVYRVAMPGHEHRVGAPQAPHHHPDDPAPHAHAHPLPHPVPRQAGRHEIGRVDHDER